MKNLIKKSGVITFIVKSFRVLYGGRGIFLRATSLLNYYHDIIRYWIENKNNNYNFSIKNIYPCVFDKTNNTPLGVIYFFQDTWCAKKIFDTKPKHHYDIGSLAELVGIISQYVPTTMIDIRPLKIKLDNLNFIKGDICKLPFKDDEIESLSSICVIEHIGLGRYGDKLDSFGSEKAAKELSRVLSKNGNLFISVPIDSKNQVYFNAHRAFTRTYILDLFSKLKLVEEKYIYGDNLENTYDPNKGFGTGLYHFRKR